MSKTRATIKTRPDASGLRADRNKLANHVRHNLRSEQYSKYRNFSDDEDLENEPEEEMLPTAQPMQVELEVTKAVLSPPQNVNRHANCAADARREALKQWKEQKTLREQQKKGLAKPSAKHASAALKQPTAPTKPTKPAKSTTTATTAAAATVTTKTSTVTKPTTTTKTIAPTGRAAKATTATTLACRSTSARVASATTSSTTTATKPSTKAVKKNLTTSYPSKTEVEASIIDNLVASFTLASPRVPMKVDTPPGEKRATIISTATMETPPTTATTATTIAPVPFDSALFNFAPSSVFDDIDATTAPPPTATTTTASTSTTTQQEQEQQQNEHEIGPDYFLALMQQQKARLNELCDEWGQYLTTTTSTTTTTTSTSTSTSSSSVNEQIQGEILAVIGKAKLIVDSRFKQYAQICCNAKTNSEKLTTNTDLQGFWELNMIQVHDVLDKFLELENSRARNWVKLASAKKAPRKKTTTATTTTVAVATTATTTTVAAKPANNSARERFLKFKAEKALQKQQEEQITQETNEPSSITILTPVIAPRSVRKSLGSNYVLTPCRRSTRKSVSGYRKETVASVSRLLEQTEFAYMPNKALVDVDLLPSSQQSSLISSQNQDDEDPLTKYLFGTPSKPDFAPPQTPRSTARSEITQTPTNRLSSLTPAKSALKPLFGSSVSGSARRIPLSQQFDEINSLF